MRIDMKNILSVVIFFPLQNNIIVILLKGICTRVIKKYFLHVMRNFFFFNNQILLDYIVKLKQCGLDVITRD